MKTTSILLWAAALTVCLAGAIGATATLDSSTAFFEGAQFNYIIPPPRGYEMLTAPAQRDGYSLAFVPKGEPYESASAFIAVTLYRALGHNLEDFVRSDTAAARAQFGAALEMWSEDSVRNFAGTPMKTIFFENKYRFIPLVMISYFNGDGDILIFELQIADGGMPRFTATQTFVDFLSYFKALRRKTLGDAADSAAAGSQSSAD